MTVTEGFEAFESSDFSTANTKKLLARNNTNRAASEIISGD